MVWTARRAGCELAIDPILATVFLETSLIKGCIHDRSQHSGRQHGSRYGGVEAQGYRRGKRHGLGNATKQPDDAGRRGSFPRPIAR